uniref:Uncharacterized protein LOC114335668 n=1 Tax=Diabrotica virgifera virgifera TaxID=50390 RepID=A0A6P7FYV4_DIAVI
MFTERPKIVFLPKHVNFIQLSKYVIGRIALFSRCLKKVRLSRTNVFFSDYSALISEGGYLSGHQILKTKYHFGRQGILLLYYSSYINKDMGFSANDIIENLERKDAN